MFTRCIFCHQEFGSNQSVERFPVGRRIAFDPGRGRLWAVCDGCRRWSLAPIEERWEALEELEKLARDRGRLLSQSENIALIRAEDLELVQVGRARLDEEAWWRYGKELRERRSRYKKATYVEWAAIVGLSIATGGGFWMFGGEVLNNFLRWRQFGPAAWRGSIDCERCGRPMQEIRFKQASKLLIVPDTSEGLELHMRCRHCKTSSGQIRIEGTAAQHVLRRTLAWRHFNGASDQRVKSATRLIEDVGSAERLTRQIADRSMQLDKLDHKKNRTEAIALEIALNDDVERRLLEMELAELESRWREEEEIAAIIDGELTPMPALEQLRRMLNGRPRVPDGAGRLTG